MTIGARILAIHGTSLHKTKAFGSYVRVSPHCVREADTEIYIDDLRASDWKGLISALKSSGGVIRHPSGVSVFETQGARQPLRAHFEWVAAKYAGAVLDADPNHVQHSKNPLDQYRKHFGKFCGGNVGRDADLMIEARPKSASLHVDDDNVFDTTITDILQSDRIALGSVRTSDQAIPGWSRVFPMQQRDLLHEVCFQRSAPCASCGKQYSSDLGIWIASPTVTSPIPPVAKHTRGFLHQDLAYPIVISLEFAILIDSELGGKGYRLRPIHRENGNVAQLALEFLSATRQLREI